MTARPICLFFFSCFFCVFRSSHIFPPLESLTKENERNLEVKDDGMRRN